MRLPIDKAISIVKLFVEGMSVRSIERFTGVHRDTILRVLALAGERCEKLLEQTLVNLPVHDVQCDEMWGFVAMKEKAKGRLYKDVDTCGDAYTYVAIERNTKLILAWHLGKRSRPDTLAFILKLRRATSGKFQLSTDGWPSYPMQSSACLVPIFITRN
jgi:IS1 family transposase